MSQINRILGRPIPPHLTRSERILVKAIRIALMEFERNSYQKKPGAITISILDRALDAMTKIASHRGGAA